MKQQASMKVDIIETDKIVAVSNPRTDYGDIDGLAADIAARGLVEPLILNEKRELVDGHRRLLALQRNQATTASCIIAPGLTASMREEIKLVTSLHKKNLTPIEEGWAFAAYLAAHKVTPEAFAKRINKPVRFVEERLRLNGLTAESVTALQERKIELGHAQIIAQLRPQQQQACVNEIIANEYTVQQFSDVVRFNPQIDFGDLPVRLQERWGGAQTTLDCAELLETQTGRNDVLQAKMKKELAAYLAAEREKVRAKGITVFASKEELHQKYPKAEEVTAYGDYSGIYQDVLTELPRSKRFAVVIEFHHTLDKTIYCVQPEEVWAEVEAKHKAQQATTAAAKSPKQRAAEQEETDRLLGQTREERLRKNIAAYRHDWMIGKARGLTKQGSRIAKAVVLQVLMEHLTDWKHKRDAYGEELCADLAKAAGRNITKEDREDADARTWRMEDCLTVPARELDGFMHRAALAYAHQEDDEWLNTIIEALRVDYTKEFVLTREYLDLYTKDQLVKLAKRAKVSLTSAELVKKQPLMDAILARAPKGFVPKEFMRVGKVSA
jgi:ParB/RepB/Spo0J family partition protein